MNWIEALFIGFIQGISEFLPISSTAHLILFGRLLGIEMQGTQLSFELFLHVASLLAVLFYFRQDLYQVLRDFFVYFTRRTASAKNNFRFVLFMAASTLITMIVGKGFEQMLGNSLTTPATIGVSLIVTGLFLILIEHGIQAGAKSQAEINWKDSIFIGVAQALAIIPGISRSGSTLIAALWCGLSKDLALRYSFLLSIPIILGLSLLKLTDFMNSLDLRYIKELWLAFAAAFLSALIGIKWMIDMVKRAKLSYFAVYCIAVGIVTWLYF